MLKTPPLECDGIIYHDSSMGLPTYVTEGMMPPVPTPFPPPSPPTPTPPPPGDGG